MAVATGTRFGPYEVLGLIGAGGMGEVYKARDTRLDRTVAVKVLPAQLSHDSERRVRFEREAKAIAGLTHPHICTLHDVGQHEGSTFLVMEHLEGETLAHRLEKGALPLEQAQTIATEVADALTTAHRQGVVHRDLKPANVMLTKTGVKLLDFGLAKLTGHGEHPAVAHLASAVTQSTPLTGEGRIVGTLQYMAPEQLEGKPADARTDLWALGAILYEMVTGKRAFEGTSAATLIGVILNREPARLSTVTPLTPAALERLVMRCLAKDPDHRWDSAHDVADELRWISQTGFAAAIAGASAGAGRWRAVGLVTALVVLSVLAGAALLWRFRPAASPAPVVRSLLDLGPADELNAGGLGAFSWQPTPGGSRTALAWTPDGRGLVFVGRRGGVQQLYLRELDRAEARALAGTDDAQVPVMSPDGAWVAFWSGREIKKVPLAGGPPVVVCRGVALPLGMSWSEGGYLVYAGLTDGVLWQVSSAGGSPATLTKRLPDEWQHALPHVLPEDAAVLYTVRRYEWIWSQEEVTAQNLATGARKVLLRDAVDARYVRSGHLVFLRQGTLLAVPFDLDRLEVRGSPVPLLDGVVQALTAGNTQDETGAGQFSVAPTGALAYLRGSVVPVGDRTLLTVDRQGTATPLAAPPRSYGLALRASPDRRHLAVTVKATGEEGLWLYDMARGTLTRLTPPGGEQEVGVWTPDAQRVAFHWNRVGTPLLHWQRADGSGSLEVLAEGDLHAAAWSPDGRELLVVKDGDVWVMAVGGSGPGLRPLVQAPQSQGSPGFSPDGRALVYDSNESDRHEVYAQPYPGPGPRIQVSVNGGLSPAWNPRGGELFYITPVVLGQPRRLMVVGVRTSPQLSFGTPRVLFEFSPRPMGAFACTPIRCYDVAPDGRRFFTVGRLTPAPPRAPVTHINLVLNWFEELKAKVPTR